MSEQISQPRIKLVNPLGQPQAETTALAMRLGTLNGARVGLINTGKPRVEYFLDQLEESIRADYPDVSIVRFRKDFTSAKPIAHEAQGRVHAAISAWGD